MAMALKPSLRTIVKPLLRSFCICRWPQRSNESLSKYFLSYRSISKIPSAFYSTATNTSLSLSHPSVQKYIEQLNHDHEPIKDGRNILRIAQAIREKQEEIKELIALGQENAELKESAELDVKKIQEVLEGLEDEFFSLVVEPDRMDYCSDIILEVSNGVGGQEAMLFSQELFEMYENYALFRGWECTVAGMDKTEIGGIRHGTLLISGPEAYRSMKFEGGVHRVQRIPKTEKAGRIHTSAATVAIIPNPSEIEVNINPGDLKIETKRASGAGGQHVNKTESAVRITHLPSGIVVECQTDRSQIKNKSNAMRTLQAKLYQAELDKQTATIKSSRKLQVGMGGRNEKIRTYNYVQDRVTDHRIGLTVYNLKGILGGCEYLHDVICKLQDYDHRERLQEIFK